MSCSGYVAESQTLAGIAFRPTCVAEERVFSELCPTEPSDCDRVFSELMPPFFDLKSWRNHGHSWNQESDEINPPFPGSLISSALMIETWISHRVGPPGASATPSSSIPPTRRRRSGARPSSIARNRWEPRSGATRWATRLGYGMGCRVASMLHPKIFGWPSTWQVGALEHEFYDFPCIGNVMIPTDFHSMIFQRGRSTTNQHGLRTVSPWTKLTKEKVWAHEPSRSCSDFDGWFSNSTLRPSKFIYIILEAMI